MLELICENCGEKFIRRKFVRVPLCLKCLAHRRHPPKGTTREKVDRNNQIMLAKKSGKKQNQIAREFGISKQAVSEIIKRPTKRAPDAGDSAASQTLSPQSGESTPEVVPAATQRR